MISVAQFSGAGPRSRVGAAAGATQLDAINL